ncbi:ER lumen protein retaining receptor 2 [Trichinella sp. T8]|nr:ER lumen protein retaining receptor 2 [Trichinella sp. T8]
MNYFYVTGNAFRFFSLLMLFLKMWETKSAAGVSASSVILFAIVFTTRYADLLVAFYSYYNTIMKMVYLLLSYSTVYLIFFELHSTYDHGKDLFRTELLIIPSFFLALTLNYNFEVIEICWTFSIYLETVALVPQLYMVLKSGFLHSTIRPFLYCFTTYRTLYLFSWIYRYFIESRFELISIISGCAQMLLLASFFNRKLRTTETSSKFGQDTVDAGRTIYFTPTAGKICTTKNLKHDHTQFTGDELNFQYPKHACISSNVERYTMQRLADRISNLKIVLCT